MHACMTKSGPKEDTRKKKQCFLLFDLLLVKLSMQKKQVLLLAHC